VNKPTVFIYTPVDESGESHRRLEEAGCVLKLGSGFWKDFAAEDRNIAEELDETIHALMSVANRRKPVTREALTAAENLRIISKYTIGVDDIDVEAATELGILVTHCPTEANWGGVAECAMAMMLDLLKKIRQRDRHVKEGGWRHESLEGTYLGARQDGYAGLTVGIVGLGRIGTRLADLLAPWRVRIIAADPYVDLDKFIHHGVERVDLDTLLRQSDVISLHCNLTEETRNLIGEAEFAMMKETAVFLNTARGPMVDEDALALALERDTIAAAAIDVFAVEPIAAQSPLLGMGDKILVSPHAVGYNRDSGLGPSIPWATEAVLAALQGQVPEHVYNKDAIDKWLDRFGGVSVI
jgi:phosphoglycerate dehydrogenase-like enzyme|tara:strand:+ start:172 stop:1233 length:1062 start_codon:yes stop_codon:yes gene_type:complete